MGPEKFTVDPVRVAIGELHDLWFTGWWWINVNVNPENKPARPAFVVSKMPKLVPFAITPAMANASASPLL